MTEHSGEINSPGVPTPPSPEDNQVTNQDKSGPNSTRRDFLKGTFGILALAAAGKLGEFIGNQLVPPKPETQQPDTSPLQTYTPEQTASPEVLKSRTEFGFNTHVHALLNGETDNMTLDAFKGDVDRLVGAKQEWIRFNFINNGIAQADQAGAITFSDKIAVFDEAIEYAGQKGLKIALVTNPPESLANQQIDQYAASAGAFYSELAKRYKGKIETWQIFNEADTHHFRDYHDISQGFEAAYLDDLAKIVSASASAIKSQDPGAKVTMNASLWAPDRSIIRGRTEKFFDPLASSLDIISLDPYPDVYDPTSAQTIPQDIEYFHKRYGKDIAIAEIGVASRDIPDPQRRSKILIDQLSAIKGGNVAPNAVFIYEMRNEAAAQDPREQTFGTADIMDTLTEQMQPPQGNLSTPQATA